MRVRASFITFPFDCSCSNMFGQEPSEFFRGTPHPSAHKGHSRTSSAVLLKGHARFSRRRDPRLTPAERPYVNTWCRQKVYYTYGLPSVWVSGGDRQGAFKIRVALEIAYPIDGSLPAILAVHAAKDMSASLVAFGSRCRGVYVLGNALIRERGSGHHKTALWGGIPPQRPTTEVWPLARRTLGR